MTGGAPSDAERTHALIEDLRSRSAEASWFEFKENNTDARLIGRLISALSNAARLEDQPFAYVIWGIRDGDHAVVGTRFVPADQREQQQPLELWLAQRLQPGCAFRFEEVEHRGQRLVLLTIPAALNAPVEFEREALIRLGSATPRLADHPVHQQALWAKLQSSTWEAGVAARYVTGEDALARLDHHAYFELTGQPAPGSADRILECLLADGLLTRDLGGRWNVTNLGALLFARRLSDFGPVVARNAVRFVSYGGSSRAATVTHRHDVPGGYARGLVDLVAYVEGLLPRNEFVHGALREERPLYPSIALRELIANALIHQDLTISGAGPLVELFSDRMEITNPGRPLVSPDRFLDAPPRSRNEALASLMRRMRLCEEQGTGIDKVFFAVELHQLPPLDIRAEGEAVRVVLFAPRRFADMTTQERVRACYQHAGLRFVSGGQLTNASLRERLGIAAHNASQASVVIRAAADAGLIRPADPERPRAGYVPFWA